ncbi:MAG: hypothetical protein B6D58_01045 [candidate division Zixibacteria bacterium 4484_95]|nr:MAG: hypothetical protein B6D58_01045 [candidate division Zixibacteria bacterium 4484_95]
MKHISLILLILISSPLTYTGQGIPFSKLYNKIIPEKLVYPLNQWKKGYFSTAIKDFEELIKSDSTLIPFVATITGGNYHLIRLTDNIYADRVGGFSPSGTKLIFTRDTSVTRLDDGFFDWLEKSRSEVVYFDFETGKETTIKLPYNRCFSPKFQSNTSFFYIASNDSTGGDPADKMLMLFHLDTKISDTCLHTGRYGYCPYKKELIYYEPAEDAIIRFNPKSHNKTILYSNSGLLNHYRPLTMIQNLSAGDNIITFQAGSRTTCIYGILPDGGTPEILTKQQLEYGSNAPFCPAAVAFNEFAYLANTRQGVDIFYHIGDMDFRLTYDGGDKYYLAISADGSKIAYSYKPKKLHSESYDIFILDFSNGSDISDIKYRFMNLK